MQRANQPGAKQKVFSLEKKLNVELITIRVLYDPYTLKSYSFWTIVNVMSSLRAFNKKRTTKFSQATPVVFDKDETDDWICRA